MGLTSAACPGTLTILATFTLVAVTLHFGCSQFPRHSLEQRSHVAR